MRFLKPFKFLCGLLLITFYWFVLAIPCLIMFLAEDDEEIMKP
jgi:hypothetical protein